MCMSQHLLSGPSLRSKGVNASVHVCVSTPIHWSAPFPSFNSMEMCTPLCGPVCVFQVPLIWCHTFGQKVYIHQYTYSCPPDSPCLLQHFAQLCTCMYLVYGQMCTSLLPLIWCHTFTRWCTCISTGMCVHLTPPSYSCREMSAPVA